MAYLWQCALCILLMALSFLHNGNSFEAEWLDAEPVDDSLGFQRANRFSLNGNSKLSQRGLYGKIFKADPDLNQPSGSRIASGREKREKGLGEEARRRSDDEEETESNSKSMGYKLKRIAASFINLLRGRRMWNSTTANRGSASWEEEDKARRPARKLSSDLFRPTSRVFRRELRNVDNPHGSRETARVNAFKGIQPDQWDAAFQAVQRQIEEMFRKYPKLNAINETVRGLRRG